MEERSAKISFNKSGRGSYTPKVTLPMSWIKEMGISQEDRSITLSFDVEEIRIKKAQETGV